MKKLILLLIFMCTVSGFGQFSENFESSTGLPTGWNQYTNGVGGTQVWGTTSSSPFPSNVCQGTNAAYVDREFVGQNNTEMDYLVTPLVTVPINGELRFSARQRLSGDQGTKYRLYVSTNADPSLLSAYTQVKQWDESNGEDGLNSVFNVCQEKKVDLANYGGQNVYLAFVRVFTQTGPSLNGDTWFLDDVKLFTKCARPTNLGVTNVFSTTATLTWSDSQTPDSWEVEYVLAGGTPTGSPNTPPTKQKSLLVPGLQPNTLYQYYVRTNCGYWASDWAGPFDFKTSPFGTYCAEPIAISSLPFQEASSTSSFKDLVDGLGSNCGAIPATTDYLGGNDVFYKYTATESGLISVKLTPTATFTGVFIYDTCPVNAGTTACIAGMADNGSGVRFVNNIPVTAGQTYYIVVSSSATTQTYGYTLVVQKENCTPPVGSIPTSNNITMTSATLSWTNPTNASKWEVEVQPLGTKIPSGAGSINVDTNPTKLVENLTSGTQYQYYVRSECAGGVFSSWAGPYPFNTKICNDTDKCNYVFSMTDTAGNGWNGATMQVKQKGIVVATIGDTFTAGSGPVNVSVPMCPGIDFELFWNVGGNAPTQCVVSVINSFNQTLFTKAATDKTPGQIVYSDVAKCDAPVCNIVPTGLTSTGILAHQATVSWNAPSTNAWEIYVVPSGSPKPVDATTPTNTTNVTNPYIVTQYTDLTTNLVANLLADTSYDFYIRVKCNVLAPWSEAGTFKTLATCPKPNTLGVTNITTTTATLSWLNGSTADNTWEILLLKGYPNPPAAPPVNPIIGTGEFLIPVNSPNTSPFPVSGLAPATIYYYYVRTICPGNDKSTWAGPFIFNTSVCDAADKCNYRFILSDSGNDGWNNGRMQVRQNGIVVATIGGTISGGGPTTVNVALCNGIPFDLYWNVTGDKPQEIGLKIQNPFTDVLYTKAPGVGAPQTVLFSGTGNCAPPTCPKPSGLKVDFVGSTSATISWTENATPGATQWNVYVVPAGTTPPVNDNVVSNVKPYYVTTQNPFTIPAGDLQPSTAYEFYVRSMCSGTDVSTWQIVNLGKFSTTPVNDECANAIIVPVNPKSTCDATVSGNTFGGTQSQPLTSPACSGSTADDIWYSFVATSDMHLISFNNIKGGTSDLNHVVYSGTDCSNLTQLYCSDPNNSIASGLVKDQKYFIRVYTKGFDKTQSATFDLCITTPPVITNDECVNAVELSVNDDVECVNSLDTSLTRSTMSSQINSCIGTADDDVWFKFTAKTTKQFITLSNVLGTTQNLNHAVYTGDCGNLTLKYCSPSNALFTYNTSFVAGQTYYIRVWSFDAVKQGADFNICITTVNPAITADGTKYSDQQLVEDVLLGTKCASVTNVTSSTGTKYGSVNGIGYFNKAASLFPFEDGIVLSTGGVNHVPGPSNNFFSDGNNTWKGDKDLEQIILQGTGISMASLNASILEFDFIPITDKLSFNFLLASNEYGTYQCDYADAFAFILTNKSSNVIENLAVVPSTTTPISVITIRDEKHNSRCSSLNEQYFDKFYGGPTGLNKEGNPINFLGRTKPLKAEATVFPGVQYHIKMVIADRGDYRYDSAVFIEGGSFSTGNVDLGQDKLISNGTALCNGETQVLSLNLSPTIYNFQWYKDGNILADQTSSSYTVTSTGVYSVEVSFKSATCIDTYSITVEYYPAAGTPSDLIKCNALSTDIFDFTENTTKIMAPFGGSPDYTLAYFESESDAQNSENPIANTNSYENKSNPQTIYARVDNHIANCNEIITFQLILQDKTPDFNIGGNPNVCADGSTVLNVVPLNGFDPKAVTYTWEKDDAVISNATSQSLTVKGTDVPSPSVYSVTVNNSGCTAEKSVTVASVDCNIQKGISPDGDGKNDNFDLTSMNPKRLEIFNRYGTEVFSKDNYTNEWHGQTNSGKDLPDGTYFYEIHTRDNKTKSGWIYINRKH